MKIALMPNLEKPEALACGQEIMELLGEKGCTFVHRDSLPMRNDAYTRTALSRLRDCDLLIAVGGDGTIIHTAKLAASLDKPILGVNAGTLGFTAGLERSELPLLTKLLTDDYYEEPRLMLSVQLVSMGKKTTYRALNDAVISGELARLIDYEMDLGQGRAFRCRADGFLVATPTGSTAYSLSAGGPVIQPDMQCLVYTPICPHAFFNRSLVFGGDTRLIVAIPQNTGRLFLTVDGDAPVALREGDVLKFSRSRRSARFIRLKDRSFFEVLDRKLISTR